MKWLWNTTTIGLIAGCAFFWGYSQPKVNNVKLTTTMTPGNTETLMWTNDCPKALEIQGISYTILVQESNRLVVEYCDANPFKD